jgi:maltose phosphorylase
MKKYLKIDPWRIIEEGFDPENQRASESIFSIGNGHFGQRANFEESYSGETLQGSYIAGVYYPDKTKVGWWKNGYPEYFAKVLNSPNWIGINLWVDGEEIDLAKCNVLEFKRTLDMKEGLLQREYICELSAGKKIKAKVVRFISMSDREIGAIKYSISPINFSGKISVDSFIDGAVKNTDANYGDSFWDLISADIEGQNGFLVSRTRKTGFDVCLGMSLTAFLNGKPCSPAYENSKQGDSVHTSFVLNLLKGDELTVVKIVTALSSLDHPKEQMRKHAVEILEKAVEEGYTSLFEKHKKAWLEKWEHSDILIEGDDEAQQGIRFNIFQLNQTYTGDDERLNIGPKGFTGEKYGGGTYWDTEAYCLPFFLCTSPQKVSKNLLIYRYKHLQKAIENAHKLGFKNGAALYPMVTMNGEECHNEWEITFEEIHRNGAIAFAIYNYINHFGDNDYLLEYGFEVLLGISRFWAQRVNFSVEKGRYVILGVTGPNEYENNVNNNWYTNTLATWTLSYTLKAIKYIKGKDPSRFMELSHKASFDEIAETKNWKEIIKKMYYPLLEKEGIFLQQDGYMDKEQLTARQLDADQRPINQYWSWDRILRSCFIKQADVLQGIYLFEDRYDTDTIRKHFEFYEPRTVHESSLSPCVHAIIAARIGNIEKAYELYMRTSRLDLDDYNNEVDEGLHITSMAGTWMSLVEGFGGKRAKGAKLLLNPRLPEKWDLFSFKLNYCNNLIKVKVDKAFVWIENISGPELGLIIYGIEYCLSPQALLKVDKKSDRI